MDYSIIKNRQNMKERKKKERKKERKKILPFNDKQVPASTWRLIGWLVELYGLSTVVAYLMPNPIFTYILNIWFENTFGRHTFNNVCLSNVFTNQSSITNNSIKHKSTKSNDSKYCYVSLTIQLNISNLFKHSLMI